MIALRSSGKFVAIAFGVVSLIRDYVMIAR